MNHLYTQNHIDDKEVVKSGTKVTLTTNGTILNEKRIKNLCQQDFT